MPRISKLLTSGESLYHFSDDIVWGCRYYARQSRKVDSNYSAFVFNASCVFLAGSFLDAKLNELTAQVISLGSKNTFIPLPFWRTVHESRKTLSFKDKWNLISSASNGTTWNAEEEPFQSYDLIVSLRNELVHYKPEYGKTTEPPIKKIKALLKRFKGPGFISVVSPADTYWVTELLSSRQLSTWVSETVDIFDMKFEHLLSAKEFTDNDKFMYQLRAVSHDPWGANKI